MTSTPPAIELRQLHCFRVMLEERHLERAAQRLGMSPQALADVLRDLEDQLAVTLLSGHSSALLLTAAGRVLAEQAREILASVDRALADTRRAGGLDATLHVGCVPDLPLQQLQAFLGAFYLRAPDLDVEVIHLRGAEQLSRLYVGELDLGIVHGAGSQGAIEREPLFRGERLAAFLPLGHRLACRPTLGPDDLTHEQLLVFPRAADPALADRLMAQREGEGYRFRGVRETRSTQASDLLFAVAGGRGVTLGPVSMSRVVGDAATIVTRHALHPPLWMPDVTLAWRAKPSPQLGRVLPAARVVARELHACGGPPA